MMMTLDNRVRRSPWREPMVWLVAAFPAAAVVASIALLIAATRSSGTNDLVADRVQRTAQMQVTDLTPDARARELHLAAVVRSDEGYLEALPADGEFDRSTVLTLSLHHPLRADQDRTLRLAPTPTGWRTEGNIDLAHDWNVQLGPADGSWRLQGRWVAQQHAAYLHPALQNE